MTARWEHAELSRTRTRGRWRNWAVQRCEIRNGAVIPTGKNERIYAPAEHPELPSQFAQLHSGSELTLERFVRTYGRLGFDEIASAEGEAGSAYVQKAWPQLPAPTWPAAVSAEPIAWIVGHARTIDWCLRALAAVTSQAPARQPDLERLWDSFPRPYGCRQRLESTTAMLEIYSPAFTLLADLNAAGFRAALDDPHDPFRVSIRPSTGLSRTLQKRLDQLAPAVVWFLSRRRAPSARELPSPKERVSRLVGEVLTRNLINLRRQVHQIDGRLQSLCTSDSLLETIYDLIADHATGGTLRTCEGCGAVFLQTDHRQRFCPPRVGQDKSSCGTRARVQRKRARDAARKRAADQRAYHR